MTSRKETEPEGLVPDLVPPPASELDGNTPRRPGEELTDSEVGRALHTPEAPLDEGDKGIGVALSVEQIDYLKSRTTKLSVEIENEKDPQGLPMRPTHNQMRKWVSASVPGVVATAEEATGGRICLLFEDVSGRKVFEVGVRRMTMWKGRQTWNYVFEPTVADLMALLVNGIRFKPSTRPLVTECLSPYHVRQMVGAPDRPEKAGVWETVRKGVRRWWRGEEPEELEEAIPRAPEGLSKTPGLTVRTLVFNESSLPPSEPVRIKDVRRQVQRRLKETEKTHPIEVVTTNPESHTREEEKETRSEARVRQILESAHGGSILHELAPASPLRRRITHEEPPLRPSPEPEGVTDEGKIEKTPPNPQKAQEEVIMELLKEQEKLRQQLANLSHRGTEEGEGANSTWLPKIPVVRLNQAGEKRENMKPPQENTYFENQPERYNKIDRRAGYQPSATTGYYEYTPEERQNTFAPYIERTPKRSLETTRPHSALRGRESGVHWPAHEDIREEEDEFVEFPSRTSTPQKQLESRSHNTRGNKIRSVDRSTAFGGLNQKTPKITPFSGKNPVPSGEDDFDAFEFGVESLRNRYSEEALKEGVHAALRAPASLSARALGYGASIDQIMEKLRMTYGPVQEHDSARAKFFSVQQDREEGVTEFMSRLDQLCERWVRMDPTYIATPATRDALMKERFFGGLRKGLQDSIRYLGEQRNATFEQVFEAARKAEEILRTRKFLTEQNKAAAGPIQHPQKQPQPQKSGQFTNKRGRSHGNNQARNARQAREAQQSENDQGAASDWTASLH